MSEIAVRDAVLQDEELQNTLARMYARIGSWCGTMFPERFYRSFSSRHQELFDILDNRSLQKVLVICHRGFGKTSIVQLGMPSRGICYHENLFIMPVSASNTSAVMQSENLKAKLTQSKDIRNLFGPMKSEVFAKDMWRTSTGTVVFPRGAGQQVRSNLYGDSRPDLIIVDDLEDKEGVRNEEQRKKLKEWFFSDLLGCVDAGSKTSRVIMIGTLLHEDSLLANLYEDPDWVKVNIPLCDDEYNSYWPEFLSTADIHKMVEGYRRQSMMDEFYREYMNKCVGLETQCFSAHFFKYYDEAAEKLGRDNNTTNMVIVDPAKTVSPTADDSAIVGVAHQAVTQKLFVRDVMSGRFTQDQLYDQIFAMCYRLGATTIGVEVTTLHDFIIYPLKNEISRRGLNLHIEELKAKGKKEDRIRALIPFYRRGLVYHNKGTCGKLESQLVTFPYSKYDDIMDALAYVVPLLEAGELTMLPTTTEYNYTEGDDVESEYKELNDEDMLDMSMYQRVT